MTRFLAFGIFMCLSAQLHGQSFKVIGFFTHRPDRAHITFVHEANRWLSEMGRQHNFTYDSARGWDRMTPEVLSQYQVVLFLDSRPDSANHRKAFEQYMENGGGFIAFHFAGFALTTSQVKQNWDWYHVGLLGVGEYLSNTWRPVPATLRVETHDHPVTKSMPDTFTTAASEWYRWKNDIRTNKDIRILMSIDPVSFPLGTGPKPHEIWHEGYYPIVWTNTRYRMLYMNMGHNDIDYEGKTNKRLSRTFGNTVQDKLTLDALLWLGRAR